MVVTAGAGDYLTYAPVNLVNIHAVTARVRWVIEMRLDGPEGKLLAELPVTGHAASSSSAWQEVTVPVHDPGGTHTLYLVFRPEEGGSIAIDRLIFRGQGVMAESTSPYDR